MNDARKVRDHVTLRSRIGAEILILAKTFQAGRAPSNGANAPKNERYIAFKNWCRDSVFGQKPFRLAVHQAMVQMHQKMNVTLRSRIGAEILVFAKSFQSGRAPSNGANAPKNERSVTRSKIGTQILIFAKSFQSGRVPEFGTNVPKNERSVTSGLSGVIL